MTRRLPPLRLLDVPVRVVCEDAEAAERLALCYGASWCADGESSPAALSAVLSGVQGAWVIRIDGRPARRASGRTEAVRTFNHELLHGVMLRAPHLYYVHAAVVARGNRAAVLPGLSRAGKSTLALATLEAGARLLSDELLAFDPELGLARAFPRALKIRDECEAYFPRLAGKWRGTGEGRFLPFDALAADIVQEQAHVALVVVPRWRGLDPDAAVERESLDRCQPITPGKALLELAGSSLNFGTHRARSLDCIAALLARASCASVIWMDPHRTARSILELLEPRS